MNPSVQKGLKLFSLSYTAEGVPVRSCSMETLTVSNDEFADARSVLSSESGRYDSNALA